MLDFLFFSRGNCCSGRLSGFSQDLSGVSCKTGPKTKYLTQVWVAFLTQPENEFGCINQRVHFGEQWVKNAEGRGRLKLKTEKLGFLLRTVGFDGCDGWMTE